MRLSEMHIKYAVLWENYIKILMIRTDDTLANHVHFSGFANCAYQSMIAIGINSFNWITCQPIEIDYDIEINFTFP